MKIFKTIKIVSLAIGFLLITNVYPTTAAQFKFGSQDFKTEVGKQLQVDFFLNTEKESINALEGEIVFSSDYLNLKKIQDGNSVVNFWVEKPKLSSVGKISFSGITPGGVVLENGLVFSLIFEAKKNGEASLDIDNFQALLNDGEGTKANLTVSPSKISISETTVDDMSGKYNLPVEIQIADDVAPESFNPEIAQDKNIFDGQNFIVFATQDKGSGIAEYQVKESQYKFLSFLKAWRAAESPYLLKDQALRSFVFVKAIDLNGNQKISIMAPKYPVAFKEKYLIYVIIILSLVASILWIIFRRKKASSK